MTTYREQIITTAAFARANPDTRALTRALARGELVKLRRGAYVAREVWDAADARDRHLLRAHAAASQMQSEPVLAGFSAAAVWGMPVFELPETVTLAEAWGGGGRSAPGVRRTAAAFPTTEVVERDGLRVTTLARTALELTRVEPFARAVASMDWALWRRNPLRIPMEELADEADRLTVRFGIVRARHCVAFASHLSDSYGESLCRALMHELGFAPPTLQLELRDARGRMLPDFAWRRERVLAEFDGKGKYLRGMRDGEDPGEVVWREKKREDRLRALGWSVVRVVWADLLDRDRLIRLLVDAGVPRERR
ncbi:type IV toxin-antitoxin system AbiEi family antitoxin domain-containing protein [Galbitalea sp. SE-J8]|uniref:type IV toxin-antitoxin system AbiEi family antitoxin domain-containing protein n=1 Tax=Galbitalea sp. SE-J8 TaxID=3054952 RepID=UPI00259CF90C|nr:type IV toxin-antitoxin system AbiEi family antitoxin domain-containing protein [Galbitalea sp. SE-J8]MDM4761434.1 type IV toxin-antitoxin system AbiEi family antitoxin domain-containing protein [Galbitalea sp. SE-J8]